MKQFIFWMFCSCLAVSTLDAQESSSATWPLRVRLMDVSTALPNFWFTRYAFNPAVMVGTEKSFRQKAKQDWHWTANAGYYHQRFSESAFLLQAEIGYRQYFGRWQAAARLGAGYAHTFYPGPVYKSVDGEFQAIRNWGNPTFTGSLGLSLGYALTTEGNSPILALQFMEMVSLPFTIYTGLHQFVGLSYTFPISLKN